MAKESCPFCSLACEGEPLFCPRCGGELRQPSPLDRFLFRLRQARTLVRSRDWLHIDKLADALRRTLTENPLLRTQAEPSLVWLGKEVELLVDTELDIPRSLRVAKQFFPILPGDRLIELASNVARLSRFVQALATAQREWTQGKPPAARKVRSWFDSRTERAQLSTKDARDCIYAAPERWPAVAAVLDAEAFAQTRWLLAVAQGEDLLRRKEYPAAREQFEAMLAEDASRARALAGLGKAHAGLGDRSQALRCWREAFQIETPNPTLWKDLAWCLCAAPSPTGSELEEALFAAQRAVELAPVAACWDTLTEVLNRRGDIGAAIASAREAIRDRPEKERYRTRMKSLCIPLRVSGGFPVLPGVEDEADVGKDKRGQDGTDSDVRLADDPDNLKKQGDKPPSRAAQGDKRKEESPLGRVVLRCFPDDITLSEDVDLDAELPSGTQVGAAPSSSASPHSGAKPAAPDGPGSDSDLILQSPADKAPSAAPTRGTLRGEDSESEFDPPLADPGGLAPRSDDPAATMRRKETDGDESAFEELDEEESGKLEGSDVIVAQDDLRRLTTKSLPPGLEGSDVIVAQDDEEDDDETKGAFTACARRRPAGATQAEVPRPVTDQVHFSVTAPTVLVANNSYVLDVWAHLAKQRQEVIERARQELGRQDIRIKSRGGVTVVRGTVLTVHLSAPSFSVSDPTCTLLWDGDIGNATFPLTVPPNTRQGVHAGSVTFSANGLPIARLHFVLQVGEREGKTDCLEVWKERRYRTAFASYASQDRDAVLARVQGIQKVLPQLDVFLDVLSLRSGPRWVDRLTAEVTSRDVFYLFWSLHAKHSRWVELEWRAALKARGIEYIDPVPLVSPDRAPPPPELAQHLHFNDWVLAHMRPAGQGPIHPAPPTSA